MACHDRDVNEELAVHWGNVFSNYHYAHPPPIRVGSVVDAKDYLGAWGCGTILEERTITSFARPELRQFSFVPRKSTKTLEELLELGEMKDGHPYYKEYHVHFHGWDVCWNEWLHSSSLALLGTYTLNPWIESCTYTKQWIIQKQKGEYRLSITTVKEKMSNNVYPPTNVLIRCMASRRTHFLQPATCIWV